MNNRQIIIGIIFTILAVNLNSIQAGNMFTISIGGGYGDYSMNELNENYIRRSY